MYKKDDVKKFTKDCIKENERNGLLVLKDFINQAIKESASKGKFNTSIQFIKLSFNGINVDSYYFKNYLSQLEDEGYKVKIKENINIYTSESSRELFISWED